MICRFDGCDDDGAYGAHGVPLCRLHEHFVTAIKTLPVEDQRMNPPKPTAMASVAGPVPTQNAIRDTVERNATDSLKPLDTVQFVRHN